MTKINLKSARRQSVHLYSENRDIFHNFLCAATFYIVRRVSWAERQLIL